jgi:cullin-5
VTLPVEIEELLPEIDEFYKKQHSGRKLHWLHHWSNGTVRLTFLGYFAL